MSIRKDALFYISFCILITLFQIVRFQFAERQPFIMDELADISRGVSTNKGYELYSNEGNGPYLIRTPLLTYIIGASINLSNGSYNNAVLIRKIMWFFSIFIFLFTYIASRRYKSVLCGVIALILLCGFTTFVDRSFRVRTDLLSTLFAMPAVIVLCRSRIPIRNLFLSGIFLGLAFLTTQKAIYFIMSFVFSVVFSRIYLSGLNIQGVKIAIKETFYISVGLATPILLLVAYIYQNGNIQNFLNQCFFHAVHAGLVEETYSHTTKFLFLSLRRNPAFWFIGIAGTLFLALKVMKSIKKDVIKSGIGIEEMRPDAAFLVWSLCMLFFIFHHKIKFPYVFINIAPTLSILGAILICELFQKVKSKDKSHQRIIYGCAIVFFILLYLFPIKRYAAYRNFNNIMAGQKLTMDRIDQITKIDDAVFDGIGMAVTRKMATPYSLTARWYNERERGGEFDIIASIKRTQPKALIKNYRIKRLKDNEIQFLNDNFIWDWGNVYVAGKIVSHKGPGDTLKNVFILSSDKYAVISSQKENILIDGKTVEDSVYLTQGIHEIAITGKKQNLVLKLFSAAKQPLRLQKPFQLYPSYMN